MKPSHLQLAACVFCVVSSINDCFKDRGPSCSLNMLKQGSIIILCAWEVFFGTNVPAKKGSIFLIKGVACLIDNQVLHKKMSSKLTSGLLRVEYD